MAEKKTGTVWKVAKSVGIILVVLGVVISAYYVYALSTFGSRTGTFARRGTGFTNNRTFNQSGFNQSYFNSTRTGARFATTGTFLLNPYFEGIVMGILMLLLGIVTFKYAGVKSTIGVKT